VLTQRLVVAAVGLPLLAALLLLPEQWFAAFVTVLVAAGTVEFIRATPPKPDWTLAIGGGAAAALIAATLRTVEEAPDWLPLALIAVTAFALLVLLWQALGDPPEGAWWLGGVLYVGVLGAHWLLLRADEDGRTAVIVLLAVAFATDTGAYTTGKLIGRHLLWPAVSPSKTWEGFAGGMLAGGIAAVVAGASLLPWSFGSDTAADTASMWPWLGAMAVVLPFAAIAGDFLESALKRRMGVKDMSNVLPGMGGLLDRMDSLLVVGPCLYWILQWARPS
jgi:phosphatidate cytidylyltransferase